MTAIWNSSKNNPSSYKDKESLHPPAADGRIAAATFVLPCIRLAWSKCQLEGQEVPEQGCLDVGAAGWLQWEVHDHQVDMEVVVLASCPCIAKSHHSWNSGSPSGAAGRVMVRMLSVGNLS
jgi:hypothetical protein